MTAPKREFDISWLEQGALPTQTPEDEVLAAFHADPNKPLHVVDIASATHLGFDDALHEVLRLVGRDYLAIAERDDAAGDHLVTLTPLGRQVLDIS